MHKLKDNNPKVYKIFFEGNLVIRHAMVENGSFIHLVIKQVIMRSLKGNGAQKTVLEVQVLKKLREEHHFSL